MSNINWQEGQEFKTKIGHEFRISKVNSKSLSAVCTKAVNEFYTVGQETTIKKINALPIGVDVTVPQAVKTAKRFNITQRFNMMRQTVEMLVNNYHNALVICGKGGAGKTYTVLETFEEAGYDKVQLSHGFEDEENENGSTEVTMEGDFYIHVCGAVSPTELFKLLHDNRTATIILDDCDSAFRHKTSANLLKAVTDTTGTREVSWFTPMLTRQGYPSSFVFEGKIIIISNLSLKDIPQAMCSRSMIIDMSCDHEDTLQRMRDIGPYMKLKLEDEALTEVIDYLDEVKFEVKDFSLRTLVKSAAFRRTGADNWRDLVMFTN